MIYLAAPYTKLTPEERVLYFGPNGLCCKFASKVFASGKHILVPNIYSHPIAQFDLPSDWKFWKEFDEKLLSICDELWVLMLPGWEESTGVKAEIEIAKQNNKPIHYITL
jgi:hypothetical protein